MNAHEARREFETGRLSTAQMLDLVEHQQQLLQCILAERQRLLLRLAHYEPNQLSQSAARDEGSPANAAQQRTPGGGDNRDKSNQGNVAPSPGRSRQRHHATCPRGDTPSDR